MIGIKTWENGNREEMEFTSFDAMVQWFAETPEAGIAAYNGNEPIDQATLQQAVEEAIEASR